MALHVFLLSPTAFPDNICFISSVRFIFSMIALPLARAGDDAIPGGLLVATSRIIADASLLTTRIYK